MAEAAKPARRAVGAVRRAFAPWAEPGAVPLIRFQDVTKRLGSTAAVDALTLDIFASEFFCLLGPSGCGKSTLLRLLAGFEEPSGGQILLGGEVLAGVPPHRRPVNMMFQSYALFPHMTVAGNVAYGLKQERLPKGEIESRVEEMLRLVQLERLAGRRPDQLSGGERQRVALARALAKRPKVLLLDEPLGALDRKLREETQFQLMDLQARLGATFLVVTHDQEEAMTMADRIAVMNRGRIAQVATPGELYEEPQTRFVAEFVGEVNILEGTVLGAGEGGWSIASTAAERPLLVENPKEPLRAGQRIAAAVRPEKMQLHRERPADTAPNVLAGEVWDIGYRGDWTVYRVRLPNGAVLRVSRPNQSRFVDAPVSREDPVFLSFAPAAAVIFGR